MTKPTRKHNRKTSRRVRKGRKGYARSADKRGQVMVNRTPSRQHNVIAPRYYTRVAAAVQGNVPVAGAATFDETFCVSGNVPFLPFSHGGAVTDYSITDSGNLNMVVFPATGSPTSATVNSQGFVTPLLQMYRQFKTFASKIRVTFVPTTPVPFTMCIYPYRLAESPGSSYAPPTTNIMVAKSLPYAKWKMFQLSDDIRNNTIELYIDSATILGLTKEEYKIRPDVNVIFPQTYTDTSVTPSYIPFQMGWAFAVLISTMGIQPVASATSMPITIELDQYLLCESPVQDFGIGYTIE